METWNLFFESLVAKKIPSDELDSFSIISTMDGNIYTCFSEVLLNSRICFVNSWTHLPKVTGVRFICFIVHSSVERFKGRSLHQMNYLAYIEIHKLFSSYKCQYNQFAAMKNLYMLSVNQMDHSSEATNCHNLG